jgi:hypothetical protein
MISYDVKLSAPDMSYQKRRLGYWLGIVLMIGLSFLIAGGIGLAVCGDAVPDVDWFLRPAPQHLLMIHYGRNEAYTPTLAVSPRAALPSTSHQHDDLSIAPDAATIALAAMIRAGTIFGANTPALGRPPANSDMPTSQTSAVITAQSHDWDDVPQIATVYGRQSELAQLERWLAHDRCQLIAVLDAHAAAPHTGA